MAEEIAKIRIEIDGKEAQDAYVALNAELKDVNRELAEMKKNGEMGSEEFKELRNRKAELNSELKEMKHNIDINDASIDQLASSLKYWQTEARKAKEGSEEWIEATEKIQEIKPKLKELNDEMNGLGDIVHEQGKPSGGVWSNWKESVLAVFTGTGLFELAKAAGTAILDFGMEVFELTGKFEKYEAVLKNAIGTQEGAAAAMADIKKFASETPFSVDELTESYIKFVNRGLTPSMEEMTKLGDIASSQGKSFDQLTEAVLDAGTGEFERLKEFGIQASKSGDQVELSFKGVQQTVANTPEAIQGALFAFGELEGVQGSMAAISQTLEGRVSNLGDNFDALKLTIGEGLKPVFGAIIDVMSFGIDVIKGLFTESEPIVTVFENIYNIAENLVLSFRDFLKAILPISDEAVTLRQVINGVAIAFEIATTPVRAFIAFLQVGFDSMNAIINKGKEVVNFFSPGSFKIDTSATFDKIGENFSNNMKSIQNSWTKTISETNINNMKDGLDKAIETEKKKYEEGKKRIQKESIDEKQKLIEFQKLSKEHEDKVTVLKNTSLNNQATARIQTIEKTAKSEEDRAEKTQGVVDKLFSEMNNKAVVTHQKSQTKITDTEKKEADKREKIAGKLEDDKVKANADAQKKIEDLAVKAIANDTQRKIAQAGLDYRRKQEEISKSLTSEENKKDVLELLEKDYLRTIKKINDDARKAEEKANEDAIAKEKVKDDKKLAEEKKQRDDKLKADKVSLDLGFKAEIERAKLDLALTKTNSQAQWSAKLALLQTEIAYKNAKLKQEAAAEKQRIEESVADTAQKTADIKAIEERLSSQLRQNETQLQADKVKLQEQANEARRKNNQEFFAALEQAMTGDFNKFIAFIQTKTKAEMGENQKRFADFSKTTSATLENMKMAVDLLNKLNESYTKRQLSRLSNEKNANIAKLEEEYRKGVITKEELESKKSEIDKEYDAKESELKRQAFERQKRLQIAAALIQGSMAVLSALATPPFPLGIALAIVAGVKTAIDINKIKNTKFEGRSGGVFKNAGIAEGSSHGSKYGEAGIAMYDRRTGAEVGEIEGGEPVMVLSRKTYRNNAPIINRLLDSSLNKNGAPISMRDGGTFSVSESTHVVRRMFEDGGVVDQEGAFESSSATSTASAGSTNAMIEKQSKLNEDIKKASETSAENSGKILEELQSQTGLLNQIKNKPDGSREVIHAIDSLRSNISKANAK